MSTKQDGFLIGALLLIPSDILRAHTQDGYIAAGFTDIRPAHHVVFGVLSPDGDRIVDLATKAGMTKQAMGYLVAYLEEHGYLERIPDPHDGRAQLIRRTERGWAVNRLAKRLVQDIQDEWANLLGEERMGQLLTLLRELVAKLGVEYKGSVSSRSDEDEHL